MKNLIFILFSLISIQCVFSQEITCIYFEHTILGYSCNLHIQNPNGFNNFTFIPGNHMQGRTNSDVTYILPFTSSQSPIFPSIVCQQFVNTRVIHLTYMGVQRIGDNAFNICRNLTNLEIRVNPITQISENALTENRNLRDFILENTQLATLPRNLFANQQSLLSLTIANSQFYNLPSGIFDPLTSLLSLTIDFSRFANNFPNGIFSELRNVEIISLRGNQLTTLHSSWFGNLPGLMLLDFSNNQITSLPPNIFNGLDNLRIVILTRNNLTRIHSNSFGTLARLSEMDINLNQINSIDERLIDNTPLRAVLTGGNPCDTTNGWIFDNTVSREILRAGLRQCFDNFKENECGVGNIDERVCRLEEEVVELRELISGQKELISEQSELIRMLINERK